MKIQCPHCAYVREMPEERVPDGNLTARCPSCQKTFSFSKQELRKKEAEAARKAQERGPSAVPLSAEELEAREKRAEGGQAGAVREQKTERTAAPAEERAAGKADEGARQHMDTGWEGGSVRDELRREEEEEWSFNPWEVARSLQDYPPALYQTSLRVMFAAQRFFSGLRPGPVLKSLAFFLTVCVLQTIIEHVWTVVFFQYLMPASEGMNAEMMQLAEKMQVSSSLLITVLFRCALLTMQLYIFTGIMYLCWRLIAGRTRHIDFSVVLQVVCYAQAPLLLSIIPGVGTVVGILWCCVSVLQGARAALNLTWGQTILGVTPLFMILAMSYSQFMSMLG